MNKFLAKAVAAGSVVLTPAIASAQLTGDDILRLGGVLNPIKPVEGQIPSITQLIVLVFNYLIIIAGVLALFYLIWAGIQYITASTDEDKAKKAKVGIFNAIIGIIVILVSYAIIVWVGNLVRTVTPGSPQQDQNLFRNNSSGGVRFGS